MNAALELLPLFLYGVWTIRRATRARRARTPNPQGVRAAPTTGLEDDPLPWPVTPPLWTTLDERQLIRLLTDSAP
jgi:hypothetical protein